MGLSKKSATPQSGGNCLTELSGNLIKLSILPQTQNVTYIHNSLSSVVIIHDNNFVDFLVELTIQIIFAFQNNIKYCINFTYIIKFLMLH